MPNNLVSFLFGSGTKNRELREMRAQWEETQAFWRASPLATKDPYRLGTDIAIDALMRAERRPATPLLVEVGSAAQTLLEAESIGDITPLWDLIDSDVEVAVEFRQVLARRRRWSQCFDQYYGAFSRIILEKIDAVFRTLPESCFGHWERERTDTFGVVLLDLIDDPAAIINQLFMIPYNDETFRLDLFKSLRANCSSNMLVASGFRPDINAAEVQHKLVRPADQKNKTGAELAELYLAGSPFKALLEVPVPFRIPDEVRCEHCHIVGGTGHGKTQLMQKLIHADLQASRQDGRSVIVIDSQGDLINKLVHLDLFSPGSEDNLADRLVLIDPADVEYPAALNLFDAHLDRVRTYSPGDRERVLNGVVELYEIFFGTFLGAELTQKQGVVFKYLARLMLAIPDATIHTLMKIMEDGKPFKPYMEQLDGSARYFFETEFFHPSFAATKKQVLRRLWGVLSTPAFERMFSQKRNKLDLFDAMNEGKIILVSTAKELLKREGSQLLGRFVIAMIMQSALERSTLPEYLRRPCFVYVDEAQEYFDDSIETILNQARKYRVGITLAHQTLDQLSPRLRSAMLANTSMKCAGGVSAKDARALADELRTTPTFIEGMKRRGPRTEFAVWVKQLTGQSIRLSVPLGFLESQPRLDDDEYTVLVTRNRERYCGTLADIPALEPTLPMASPKVVIPEQPVRRSEEKPVEAVQQTTETRFEEGKIDQRPPTQQPPPVRPEPEAREPGKGGRQHKYLQALVKELAEQNGLKATIEAPLPGGGQIDVLIERDGIVAAVEISVTTIGAYESEKINRYLELGYPRIALILPKTKGARKREGVIEEIAEEQRDRVRVLTPEEIPDYIVSLAPPPEPSEAVVKGYRVRLSHAATSPEEARSRRDALARVIAGSLKEH